MRNAPNTAQLWQFSLALYPKVQRLCLHWQDTLKININLLLLLCYLEQQHCSINSGQIHTLSEQLNAFSQRFTQPLRQLRRQTTSAPTLLQAQLKHTLLNAELALEKLEQQLLVEQCPQPVQAATAMLEVYLIICGADMSAVQEDIIDLRQALATLS